MAADRTKRSWDLIRALLALHRAGTFESAAAALGIDSTTMRRRIQALDQQVGTTLFTRQDGRIVVAERHAALLSYAMQMEAAHTQLLSHSVPSRSGGKLRITTLDIFASLLAPDLVRLQRLHPDIMIELTTEPHFVDLEREQIDLAIRLARPLRGANGLKRLAVVDFAIYGPAKASPQQDAGAGPPLLALYPHHGRMDHDFQLADERWHDDFGCGTIVARADGYPTLLRLCEEGMGLAMLPCLLGDASDRLRRIDPVRPAMQAGLWAVIRPGVSRTPAMRTVLGFLTDAFRHKAASLRGT